VVSAWEAAARLFEPSPVVRHWATPGQMAKALDPTTVQTPALDLIDAALVDLADGKDRRLAIFMSPQEGKSERASRRFPLWLLHQDTSLRIAIVSHNDELALGWGRAIKADVETFNGDDGMLDLGLRLRTDSKAAGRWQVEGDRGGVYCTSISGSLTGRPADVLILDDPIKDLEQAQSSKYRERAHRFWQGVAIPRMGPHTKVVLIQTRWHEDDLAGRLLATEGDKAKGGRWRVVSIPAQCEDEATDPLGRKTGEYMISARGRTDKDWDERKQDSGQYVWAALFQQRPAPAEGGLFKRLWWRYWTPAPSSHGERLDLAGRVWSLSECWRFITGDLAASTRTSADFTVAAAWALTLDGDLVLLDYNRARIGEADHYDLFRPLAQRWRVDTAFVEATQHSMTLTAEATRSGLHVTPLRADADKFSRALPYSARVSGGRVWLPAGSAKVDAWVAEHAGFPAAAHDDLVDAGAYAVRVAVTKWVPPTPVPAVRNDRDTTFGVTDPFGEGIPDVDWMNCPL
jgi:predicted phage terminase large subunit-like protein